MSGKALNNDKSRWNEGRGRDIRRAGEKPQYVCLTSRSSALETACTVEMELGIEDGELMEEVSGHET
jgi:hypothetical protein